MIQIDAETNAAQIAVQYREMSGTTARSVFGRVRDVVNVLVAGARRKVRRGSGVLNHRTGTLGRAIFGRVEMSGDDIVGRVGVDLVKARYGRIQEKGGTVRPVHGQFLAIPIGPALTGNGVARMSARQFLDNPAALGFTGAFFNRAKTAIMGVLPNHGGVQPVFALKRSVYIPGRSYLRSTLHDEHDHIMRMLGQAVDDGIDEAIKPR